MLYVCCCYCRYRAPEVLGHGVDYTYPSDLWSLGCTIAEFVRGEPLIDGDTEQEVVESLLAFTHEDDVPFEFRKALLDKGFALPHNWACRNMHAELVMVTCFLFRDCVCNMLVLAAAERETAASVARKCADLLAVDRADPSRYWALGNCVGGLIGMDL